MIPCDTHACKHVAMSHIVWGRLEGQHANLCQNHITELWSKIECNVRAGLNYWIQTEPKTGGDN